GGSVHHKASAHPSAIPEDWDEATSSEEDNQKIWDDANKKAPMPQLVVTSSGTGSISSVVPPASAFQSPIRILKRSVAPTQHSANDDSPTSALTGTFAERSARYNAARERIFAGTTEGSTAIGEGGAVAAIVRNPKGPEHAQGPNGRDKEGSQGFGTRVGKRGSPSQPGEKQVNNSRT
ncbi:hypothetical protein BJV78DRAFT_1129140, partial [Lactifluus subvellereus]